MNNPYPCYRLIKTKTHLLSSDLILPLLIPSLAISIFLASSPTATTAFNIDEEYPIVITNKFVGGNGHFGASVLLLPKSSTPNQQTSQETGITGWVVIGAPKANCTHHSNHSRLHEPGVIWRCALGPSVGTRGKKICEVVEMDPLGEYDPFDPALPYTDRKDGGWLGGSMFVGDSDRFVACASRWVNKKYTQLYLANGICYWLPKSNLMAEETSSPPSWPWVAPKLSYRLSPLLNRTKQSYKFITNTSNSQQLDKTVVYDWAFGQFGFSLHITPNNELISGSVGVLDWTGSLVYYRDGDTLAPRPQFRRYNAHASSAAFSEVFVIRPQRLGDLVQTSDYFGYSVTSGNYFHTNVSGNRTQFAAGAPRSSQLSGKVLVFTIKESAEGRSEGLLDLLVEPIEGKDTKKGNHYGSYFGQTLLSLDLNGDGFDDLLVGAPLYGAAIRYKRNAAMPPGPLEEERRAKEEEEEVVAKMKSGDEGCVFVYLSTGEDFVRAPQVLCGDKLAGARFGSAITSLKDINYDGFNDVAVGAPYENEGRGAVYIYHGGEQFLTLAQKLQPEFIDPKIKTFGWSLSLGVDIDENGYPDLAVGAYETNQVVIYRTIPIVHFEATLTAPIPKILTTTDEFNLTSCLSYSGHGNMRSTLEIWVKLTVQVDPDGKRIVSLFHGDALPSPLLVTSVKRVLVLRNDELTCYNFTAVRNGTIDGLTKTVPILMEYWMKGYDSAPGPVQPVHYVIERKDSDIIADPVHSVNLNSSKSEFRNFSLTKLPMPVGNAFGTKNLSLPVGTICEADGDPECLANLTINAFLVDYKRREIYGRDNPFMLGSTQAPTLSVELVNHRETASLPITLSIHLPPPTNVRRLPPICDHIEGGHYSCSIRRPIKETQSETFTIELDMSKVYGGAGDRDLDIGLEATTSSLLVKECKHRLSIPMRTQLRPQNFSHVDSKIEYAPPPGNESILTFGISQAFEVGLVGPSTAAALRVDLDIPRKIEVDGKMRELIGLKRPIVAYDGEVSCYAVNGSFLHDGQTETSTFPILTPPPAEIFQNADHQEAKNAKEDSNFHLDDFDNLEDGDQSFYTSGTISEVTKILLGKTKRGKRSTPSSTKQGNDFDGNEETLIIKCGSPLKRDLACLRVSCVLSHFTPQKKAVIELKLKMYNKVASLLLNSESQLHVEDISSLRIVSVGSVRALDSKGNVFGLEGKVEFVSRLGIPPPYEVPAWIIIVSVAGGLLSLLLITFVLKKCGFFRRSKRDEMMLHRKAMALRLNFNKRASSGTGSASTARIRTSSSSRKHYNSNSASISGSSRRKRSFSKTGETSNSTKRPTTLGQGSGWTQPSPASSSLSPGTIAKQRDIPGAVDLNELRRLYADVDNNELY